MLELKKFVGRIVLLILIIALGSNWSFSQKKTPVKQGKQTANVVNTKTTKKDKVKPEVKATDNKKVAKNGSKKKKKKRRNRPCKVEVPENPNFDICYFEDKGINISDIRNIELYKSVYGMLGKPYIYGGASHTGVDCQGFVRVVFDETFGIKLPGGAGNQFDKVEPVEKDQLQEGDLIFWKAHSKHITHVGIYLGNNKFAHSIPGRGVIVDDLGGDWNTRWYFKSGRLPNLNVYFPQDYDCDDKM